MSSTVEEHVIYQIFNAPLREYPYPHIYVENVFPDDFYQDLRANWPRLSNLKSLGELGRVPKDAYPDRFVMPLHAGKIDKLTEGQTFWSALAGWLLESRFRNAMISKFEPFVEERFGHALDKCRFSAESLVVRDLTNYKIGPHTDAPHRLLSLLFYCPDDDRYKHLGTSIYTPKKSGFRCVGGPHYPHAQFTRVTTMEFLPNTLFAFFKTDHSFHGVEPITDSNVQRDVLLYDIRVEDPGLQEQAKQPAVGLLGLKMLRGLFSNGQR